MHAIIMGRHAEYIPGGLAARPRYLTLTDGTRYTFDVIDVPYYRCDPPDTNNNLVEVEHLAVGAGKWMLGSESFFESLGEIQKKAWLQFDRYRAEQGFPRIPWDVFQETVRKSDQLWFPGQSEKEAAIVQETNSDFFGPRCARHWGLAQVLREQQNKTLQREVFAAAWFEGNPTPLLLRDFSTDSGSGYG